MTTGLEYLDDYFRRISIGDRADVRPETITRAVEAWHAVRSASGDRIIGPDVATGPNGELLYIWKGDRYYLSLEIIPDQPAEFFYRDRESGEIEGDDYTIGDPIPARFLEKLPLFRHAEL